MTTPESREMYGQIATLTASIAKALDLSESDVIAALDRGEVELSFGRDANGNRFVAVVYQGAAARIYQGAIKRGAT